MSFTTRNSVKRNISSFLKKYGNFTPKNGWKVQPKSTRMRRSVRRNVLSLSNRKIKRPKITRSFNSTQKQTPKKRTENNNKTLEKSDSLIFEGESSIIKITEKNRSLSRDKKFISPRGKTFFTPNYSIIIDFRNKKSYSKENLEAMRK
jgi:hypothetical protein